VCAPRPDGHGLGPVSDGHGEERLPCLRPHSRRASITDTFVKPSLGFSPAPVSSAGGGGGGGVTQPPGFLWRGGGGGGGGGGVGGWGWGGVVSGGGVGGVIMVGWCGLLG